MPKKEIRKNLFQHGNNHKRQQNSPAHWIPFFLTATWQQQLNNKDENLKRNWSERNPNKSTKITKPTKMVTKLTDESKQNHRNWRQIQNQIQSNHNKCSQSLQNPIDSRRNSSPKLLKWSCWIKERCVINREWDWSAKGSSAGGRSHGSVNRNFPSFLLPSFNLLSQHSNIDRITGFFLMCGSVCCRFRPIPSDSMGNWPRCVLSPTPSVNCIRLNLKRIKSVCCFVCIYPHNFCLSNLGYAVFDACWFVVATGTHLSSRFD